MTVLLALVAALLVALGNVLQQRVAMGFCDRLANSSLFLLRPARDPVWLLGTAVILLGFGFHAGTLASGEIVVVQPILALTLVMALPLGARLSHQRVERRDAAVVVTGRWSRRWWRGSTTGSSARSPAGSCTQSSPGRWSG